MRSTTARPPDQLDDQDRAILRILQRGYRVAYEPAAIATEEAREMGGFSRRVRVMTGNFEQLSEMKYLVKPLRPMALFFFLSHKAGRLVVPFAMLGALGANLALLGSPFYRMMLVGQLAFYGLAIVGAVWQLRPKILRLPYYFSMINAAAFLGMYYVAAGRHRMVWRQK